MTDQERYDKLNHTPHTEWSEADKIFWLQMYGQDEILQEVAFEIF